MESGAEDVVYVPPSKAVYLNKHYEYVQDTDDRYKSHKAAGCTARFRQKANNATNDAVHVTKCRHSSEEQRKDVLKNSQSKEVLAAWTKLSTHDVGHSFGSTPSKRIKRERWCRHTFPTS